MEETDTISLGDAEALLGRALRASGVPAPAAASVALALVAAEAEGQVGHGFSRLADYVAQVRSGKLRADAVPVLTEVHPASVLVDAGHGFAYPALDLAVEAVIARARAHGSAVAAVTRSHHCGALSVQVERVARAGLIGFMMANAPAAMAPWGARTRIFGTNPIAFGAPRAGGAPLVIDLSLSRVARGKVMHARKSGQAIPEGWAFDRDGHPTTDPEAALAGSMAPIGGAKGTALALMVELLAASFTGACPSAEASSFFDADGPPPGTGQVLIALRPLDVGFAERAARLLERIESMEGARLPGARRAAARAEAMARGLRVPRAYLDAARALARGNG